MAHRLFETPFAPFELFPEPLVVIVAAGLVAVLVFPRAWRSDLAIIALLYAGLVVSLLIAPVGTEGRYVIVGTAALLILSCAGWNAIFMAFRRGEWRKFGPGFTVAVTVVLLSTKLFAYSRALQYPIQPIVRAVVSDAKLGVTRVVAPPDLEGPTIAEFAAIAPVRGQFQIRRPSKDFANMDWNVTGYATSLTSTKELEDYFDRDPIDFLVWHDIPRDRHFQHELLMQKMLAENAGRWQKIAVFGPTPQDQASWAIYKFVPRKLSQNDSRSAGNGL